jgi:hypothetical protein
VPRFGVDISHHEPSIAVQRLRDAGVEFVILNCGGSDNGRYGDRKFKDWHAECMRVGMPVGAYYYSAAEYPEDARRDAEHCLSILDGRRLDYPVWMDVETFGHQQMSVNEPGRLGSTINAFAKVIEDAGYRCGVYSWKWLLAPLTIPTVDRWVCAWVQSRPCECDMWQFGGEENVVRSTSVAGYDPVDQDYAYTDYLAMGPWPKRSEEFVMASIAGRNTVIWPCEDEVHDLTHPHDMDVLTSLAKSFGMGSTLVTLEPEQYARLMQSVKAGPPRHLSELNDKFPPRS